MNGELIRAIYALEKERMIPAESLFEAIESALVAAYKREFAELKNYDNIQAEVDRETGKMSIYLLKEVVEEVNDPHAEILLEEAKETSEEFGLGDLLAFETDPESLGRLAAESAKAVIMQKISEAEKTRIQDEFSSRIGELATGVVQRKDWREVVVDIGRAEAILPTSEQVRNENYSFNQRMRFYIVNVDERHKRPVVIVSRSRSELVAKLFEQEVPEIASGIVEIVAISRDPGHRTKIAVASRDADVEALGACVGQHGARVQAVMNELGREKIDIIEWDSNPEVFISNALSPAKVQRVFLDETSNIATVIVPDNQQSLAIGREGQNAKLAAGLVNCKIDIKSESEYRAALEESLLSGQGDSELSDMNTGIADFEEEAQIALNILEAAVLEADSVEEVDSVEDVDNVTNENVEAVTNEEMDAATAEQELEETQDERGTEQTAEDVTEE